MLTEYCIKSNAVLINMFKLIPNYRFKAHKRLAAIDDPREASRILARLEKYDLQERVIKTLLKIN